MKKILFIGNSFSQDTATYLHQILSASGIDSKVVNLFIGGCPISRHADNIKNDAAEYDYQLNGVSQERKAAIVETLCEEDWDYVITQQASPESGRFDTYYPGLTLLLDTIKHYAPHAEVYLNETWAYEHDSDHDAFAFYDRSQQKMYDALISCYYEAANREGLPLIKNGEIIQALRATPAFDENYGARLCRDGFHMHLILGRYLTAANAAKTLLGIDLKKNTFLPDDTSEEEAKLIDIIKQKIIDFEA